MATQLASNYGILLPLRSPYNYLYPTLAPETLVPIRDPTGASNRPLLPWWMQGQRQLDELSQHFSVAYEGPWLDLRDPGPCLNGLGSPCPGCQDPNRRDPAKTGCLC